MVDDASMDAIIEQVQSKRHDIDLFRANTVRFFETHPNLIQSPQIVHSVRSRMFANPNSIRRNSNRLVRAANPVIFPLT